MPVYKGSPVISQSLRLWKIGGSKQEDMMDIKGRHKQKSAHSQGNSGLCHLVQPRMRVLPFLCCVFKTQVLDSHDLEISFQRKSSLLFLNAEHEEKTCNTASSPCPEPFLMGLLAKTYSKPQLPLLSGRSMLCYPPWVRPAFLTRTAWSAGSVPCRH